VLAASDVASSEDRLLADRVSGLFAGDPTLIADPYPIWNELRTRHPLWRLNGSVILSRHRDVRELLADNNVLYTRAGTRHAARYQEARERFRPDEREAFDNVPDNEFRRLGRLDPPDHSRLRRLVQAPFSVKNLTAEMDDQVRCQVKQRAQYEGLLVRGKLGRGDQVLNPCKRIGLMCFTSTTDRIKTMEAE